ncbi:glycosyltransferase [bacterium]|nr:glycosyltransferase [bacterium]
MTRENNIKVSVILPVFNVEQYLKECLESVVNQTLKDIEIICVNDGSTDSSLAILNEYAHKDNRFIVLSQENQGQGVARNNGVEIAKGKYIQFIDPDDWIELNMLETIYNFAEEHNSQVVKFNYSEYNDYSGKYKQNNFVKEIKDEYNYDLNKFPYYTWRHLKKGCLSNLDLHVWAHFYKTEFIKSNKIRFAPSKHGEDHLFADGAIVLANKIDYLNKYLYFYRIRSGSAVHIKSNINFCVFDNIRLLKEFLIEKNLFNELEEEWINYAKKVVSWHYSQVPENNIKKYEDFCMQYYTDKNEFNTFLKEMRTKRSFWEEIFSLKNEYKDAIKYKVVTIFGFKFYIKPKKRKEMI